MPHPWSEERGGGGSTQRDPIQNFTHSDMHCGASAGDIAIAALRSMGIFVDNEVEENSDSVPPDGNGIPGV